MNFSKKLLCFAFVGILTSCALLSIRSSYFGQNSNQPTLMLYCAAGVKPAIEKACLEFEARYGVKIELMYGGSGTLLNNLQIVKQGDLYLAADESYTKIAESKGLLTEQFSLALMHPVLAVTKGNPKNIQRVEDILQDGFSLSLGNPDAASIGKQTKLIFENLGLWEKLKKQVHDHGVFKPTVPDVANDIKLGAVDAGIVWDATAQQYETLEVLDLPELFNQEKVITIGVLKTSTQVTLSKKFIHFLKGVDGQQIFYREGYSSLGRVLSYKVE